MKKNSSLINSIRPAPDQGRNQATVVGAGITTGRPYDSKPSNPVGRGPSDLRTSSNALLHCRKPFTMATFNAYTIKADPKAREIAYSLNISILGVQEHRIVHQTQLEFHKIEEHHLITSSVWRNEAQAAVGGVGLLLCSKVKNALWDVRSYSSWVLSIVFFSNHETTVMVAYSLMNVSSKSVVEEFYDTLRTAICDTPAHNFLCILFDSNARLETEDTRFPFHESTNRNGKYLVGLLVESNLLAVNTCFQKHLGKQQTFQDCGTMAKSQLD